MPYVSCIRGINVLEEMVGEYNRRARGSGLTTQQVSARKGSLIGKYSVIPDPALSTEEFFNFDLAIVVLGFHHFGDPELAAKGLCNV